MEYEKYIALGFIVFFLGVVPYVMTRPRKIVATPSTRREEPSLGDYKSITARD